MVETKTPCIEQPLRAYLSDELTSDQMAQVEGHLSTCGHCRGRLNAIASTSIDWTNVLRCDEFDPWQQATIAEESLSQRGDAELLTREIKGWLDPTDDPNTMGRFAGYEIVGIVGHGGMGIVLKGFEPSLNRFVAVKVLAPRLATSSVARQRFAREAQAAAAVIHDNVIAIYRVDEAHGLPFLVMPYLGGESLERRVQRDGPLDVQAALRIASQIAAGLAAAHARGLVHRDIKPANIMLGPGIERVTITDFGLARAADDISVTRTGIVAGTPQYMSPEQARAKPLDGRSDLFSLGSVIYWMVSGRVPFNGLTSFEVLENIVGHDAEPVRAINEELPEWLEKLIYLLHQKTPDARVASARDVQRLVDDCLLHVCDPDIPLPSKLASSRPSRRMQGALAGIAIATFCLLLGAAHFMAGEQADSAATTTDQHARAETPSSLDRDAPPPDAPPTAAPTKPNDELDVDAELTAIEKEIRLLEAEGVME